MALFQTQSRRVVTVVLIIFFSKFFLAESVCVRVSVSASLFWYSWPSNLYFGLFCKLLKTSNLQWKDSNMGKFWKFLRFLPEHPQSNTFVPFVPFSKHFCFFYEILSLLSKQLQYFSDYIATVALAQPYKNSNHLTF